MTRLVLAIAMLLSLPTAVFAQETSKEGQPSSSPTKYPKVQKINIEEENVDGTRSLPLIDVVGGTRKGKHSSLIKIRDDFIPEMLKSVNDF